MVAIFQGQLPRYLVYNTSDAAQRAGPPRIVPPNTVPLVTLSPSWNVHVSVLHVKLCTSTHLFKMESRPRPSLATRLSFAVNHAERGETTEEPTAAATEEQIEEEIAEIKRYEVNRTTYL